MEWKGWKWYYDKKKELQKIASPIGSPEQVEAWKELIKLEKLANAQRYKEASKRAKKDLKRFGKAYEPIARKNLALARKQWKRDHDEVIRKKIASREDLRKVKMVKNARKNIDVRPELKVEFVDEKERKKFEKLNNQLRQIEEPKKSLINRAYSVVQKHKKELAILSAIMLFLQVFKILKR